MIDQAISLLPALCAIVLVLITKETYLSLIIGIMIGGLLYASGNPVLAAKTIVFEENSGLIANISSTTHICIMVFVAVLGMIVMLIRESGGAAAFASYVSKHIKTSTGAKLAAFFIGLLIFVDDGFNCLAVGTAMRPVADKFKVSRAKLAYIIDSTAAPVCIIAPVSSWAAAVSYSLPQDSEINGFSLFLKTIPYNFYAIGTLFLVLVVILSNRDFRPMKDYEEHPETNSDIDGQILSESGKTGKPSDMIVPMLFLVAACITAMFITGGGLDGTSIKDAFANTDGAKSLVSGGLVTLCFMFVFYIARRTLTVHEFMECIPKGWAEFVAPMIILILAWTLSGITELLGASSYIQMIMNMSAGFVKMLVPAIVFVLAAFLSFSTGTSWGTFSIMIPIVCSIFAPDAELLVITVSACLSGSVFGDHCSPISDTTIMSSAGAGVEHAVHVKTQLPYALLTAIAASIGYIFAGIIGYYTDSKLALLGLPLTLFSMFCVTMLVRDHSPQKQG